MTRFLRKTYPSLLRAFAGLGLIFGLFVYFPSPLPATDQQASRALFQKHCVMCHNSSGKVLQPADKASIQWHRFFQRKKHERYVKTPLNLPSSEQQAILKYLIAHASDSDYPEVAGER